MSFSHSLFKPLTTFAELRRGQGPQDVGQQNSGDLESGPLRPQRAWHLRPGVSLGLNSTSSGHPCSPWKDGASQEPPLGKIRLCPSPREPQTSWSGGAQWLHTENKRASALQRRNEVLPPSCQAGTKHLHIALSHGP